MPSEAETAAEVAAETIAGLADRAYGLCGGHIQPVWDALADTDTTIVDTRDERAAVHAAHADAEASGSIGVALVTAGPGFTNALTGIANAFTAGVPLLVVAGRPPLPQDDRGALQELPQRAMVDPVTAATRTVFEAERIRDHFVEAAGAALDATAPGYVEVPTDVFGATVDPVTPRSIPTDPHHARATDDAIERAAAVLRGADRPLVITGRGTRDAADAVRRFVRRAEIPVLTTAGSKGVVPEDDPFCVPGARGDAMDGADAYLLLGKRLDFTLGYGSPALFGDAAIVQVDVDAGALRRNRTPDAAIPGTVASAVEGLDGRIDAPAADPDWTNELRETHEARAARLDERKRADGTPIHPYRVCGAIERTLGDDAVVVCDGGDALSFGRIAIPSTGPRGYLDPGPLGCLGVGVPFAVGAALARPTADVVCLTGDGSIGFNLADIETAVRAGADITVVVANNDAWNIERYDQRENYGREVGSALSDVSYADAAEALGAVGSAVTDPEELDGAVERAVETSGPAVVDVAVDPDVVSPDARNGLASVPEYQPLEAWDERERARREG